ncbi:MAG: hypothetical protein NTW78_07595 [Campylobacterales bacterium]|nr:hypothetical protein [Campylobacterales bacterium]
MLKYFEDSKECRVMLHPPLVAEDIDALQKLFYKEYSRWIVEFGRIYSISGVLVHLLYKEIFENSKNISIITHKNKLNRYLNKLGFETTFISLLKDSVVKTSLIEVVLIGGSADSSPKIVNIVSNIDITNLSVVVVQHVQIDRVGIFDEILQKYTTHKVCYAKDGEKIQKGIIYLAPNNKHLKVKEGLFFLSDEEKYNYAKPSISLSYESFSAYYKESLLVIQECGYASDGVDKLEFLKRNKSALIVQDQCECEAKSMVLNAVSMHVHDYILNLEDIVLFINFVNKKKTKEAWIEYLLEMILKRYGYDFRLYQRDMIQRRVKLFMIKHEIKDIKDAVALILFNKTAFKVFFLELSINVTEFFRKPSSFAHIIQLLKKHYKKAHNIKVWSAGCSSGEEVYSLAILLQSLGMLQKTIIYATDFNSVVLEEAKNGIYSNDSYELALSNFEQIGLDDRLGKYITKNENYITIDEKIREKTLFFQHNLATDSSFNEFDIIICSNVIIYFDDNLQKRVFNLFYESLKFGGYLILGQSETVHSAFKDKFKKCSDESKIYKKVA